MTILSDANQKSVTIVGGGPAGLAAAEVLSQHGIAVDLYDAMPSVGRKFLLAGKGGMNITHSEPMEAFLSRYGNRRTHIAPMLDEFGPQALRDWVHGLGIDTFVGSSGRVFPTDMKAAPLLRAWLHRLREAGVRFHMRHRWLGWNDDGALRFASPVGEQSVMANAVLLALGGGSWARLGSDGAWVPLLQQRGVAVNALQPANCGFDVGWSEHFASRFAGAPVKSVVLACTDSKGASLRKQGDFIVTAGGVEGSAIYALSAALRDQIAGNGVAVLHIDLLPGMELERVINEIAHPRGSRSMASHLQSRLGLKGVKAALLRERASAGAYKDPVLLGEAIKSLPLPLVAPRPIDEAISSAGGVAFETLNKRLMLNAMPGVFCAGEMLDWEAPTGGYLLTACFASGRMAALGIVNWLNDKASTD
jgi:uncharacterized flavoprotein (TIGR03862 family)